MTPKGKTNHLAQYLIIGTLLLSGLAAFSAEIPESVENIVRERVDSGKTMSMVIGVVDADGVSYFSYGKLAASDDTVPDKDSVYEIGSISKVFTAILLADAVNRGEVKYDDDIETHLPEEVNVRVKNDKPITLENLSVQNSGLPRLPANFRPNDTKNPYANYSVDDMYKALARLRMKREAGEAYEYSNLGVGLLGHLLSLATDQSYEELVISRIANVLDMPDTRITLSENMQEHLATGHAAGNEVANWDLPTFAGAGALRSTAQDMIVFLEANLGLRESPLLDTMRETHAPRSEAGSEDMKIGLGWHIRTSDEGPNIVWHNGGTGGYRTFTGFVQDPPMGVVVLTNSAGAGNDDIGFHILDDSIPLAEPDKRTEIEIDTSTLEQYVGAYQLGVNVLIDISLQDNQLYAQITNDPKYPVFAESETVFFYKVSNGQLEFEMDDNGAVTAVIFRNGAQRLKAKRIQ